MNWSKLPSGSVLRANLSSSVYVGQNVAFPANTSLRLKIASSEKARTPASAWKKTGQIIVRAFSPLERTHAPEYRVVLASAEIQVPGGKWLPIRAAVVRAGSAIIMSSGANSDRAASAPDAQNLESRHSVTSRNSKSASVLVLQLEGTVPLQRTEADSSPRVARDPSARALLLTPLSASHSHEGDKFQAVLEQPLSLGEKSFDSGSLVEGTVLRRTPPRILSRAGKLYLRIDRVTSRNGHALPVSGTLTGAEADSQIRFVLDDEGTLRGHKPGVTNALVDLGISYAIGKVSDDIAETPIRAIGASMSDAAVANAARWIGLAGAATYVVTRHGRDVRLPQYSELEVSFSRASPSR